MAVYFIFYRLPLIQTLNVSWAVPTGYSEISNIPLGKPGRRLYNVREPMQEESVSVLLQIDASEGNKVITVRSPLQVRLLALPLENIRLFTCLDEEIIIHENDLAKIISITIRFFSLHDNCVLTDKEPFLSAFCYSEVFLWAWRDGECRGCWTWEGVSCSSRSLQVWMLLANWLCFSAFSLILHYVLCSNVSNIINSNHISI